VRNEERDIEMKKGTKKGRKEGNNEEERVFGSKGRGSSDWQRV
jgi:hypothetical protein